MSEGRHMEPVHYYEGHWLSTLEWGCYEAQESALYGLRLAGWDVEGCDYGSAFHWHVAPPPDHSQPHPGFRARRIEPLHKPDYGDPMAEREGGEACTIGLED